MLPLLRFDQIFPTMDGVEHRQLTAQRTHGAIVSNIFHCKRPRFTSTAYSASCERVIMIMRQNYFLDLLAVDSPSASSKRPHKLAGVIATSRKIIGVRRQSKPIVNYFHKRCAWGLRNGSYVMSWDSQFAEPIDLPNNVAATTLGHVIAYISELPDAERNSREWQNARKSVLQAADQVGSIWFARIAIIRALKRRTPRFRRRNWSPEE